MLKHWIFLVIISEGKLATLDVKINTTQLLRDLHVAMNQVMIVQLAELLHVDTDTALDWLICKASQFRSISEDDIRVELDAIDRKV